MRRRIQVLPQNKLQEHGMTLATRQPRKAAMVCRRVGIARAVAGVGAAGAVNSETKNKPVYAVEGCETRIPLFILFIPHSLLVDKYRLMR
jgi:hypothetical protein